MARPEKRRKITVATAIPADDLLIDEVLVRLPAKSLARCKCVCRSWRDGITSAAFVRRRLELSRQRRPLSFLCIPRGQINFEDGVTDADLIFEKAWPGEGITYRIHPKHCDGLVAVATTTDRVFVCNQATREFVALPLARLAAITPSSTVALGFDQWRNAYVVGRCFYRKFELDASYEIGHELFMLGSGGSDSRWELTQDPPYAVEDHWPICTRQAFYWHPRAPAPEQLMRFSLQQRVFDMVSKPPAPDGFGTLDLDEMTELDGKLCYVHAVEDASFKFWLADETLELQWTLHCRIDLLNPIPDHRYYLTPVAIDGDALLVTIDDHKVCWYNVKSQCLEEVVDVQHNLQYRRPDGSKYMCSSPCNAYLIHVVPYIESLVPLRASTRWTKNHLMPPCLPTEPMLVVAERRGASIC
ncbi:hypothetical protein U9M48_044656 [Paspalum notatum var. saurae]|uniref:F-box domain-containing protein n=1 Tax=Paspalum notatum var. saurae TaxID=547442 RepID=A0AAQ3UZS2_PASNO